MKHPIPDHNPMRGQYGTMADRTPEHFALSVADGVATVTLNRPERKNPLTFDSYAELRDWFLGLQRATDIKAVVLTGAGGNFCSGGDVHEIIGPLTKMTMPELLDLHPHDRRAGEHHARLPAAHRGRARRCVCRGRRDDGAGFGPASGLARGHRRVPVHPRGSGRR